MDVILTYRKKVITQDDPSFIPKVIDDYRSKERSFISHKLCEVWDWRQPNAHLKDCVCRSLLLLLERKNLITLTQCILDINNNSQRRKKTTQESFDFRPSSINLILADLAPVELRQARKTPEEKLFNNLIQQNQYLGYSQPVG